MAERMIPDFEARLAEAFERYVAPAPVEVDTRALAATVVAGRRGLSVRAAFDAAAVGRRLTWLAAAALLLVATGLAIVVGSRLLEAPAVRPFLGEVEPAGPLAEARMGAVVVVLADGRALVLGGFGDGGPVGTAELFDPREGTFTPAGSPTVPFVPTAATALADGRALVVGRDDAGRSVAEWYDPGSGWGLATLGFGMQPGQTDAERVPALAPLGDGRILLVGVTVTGGPDDRAAVIVDPTADRPIAPTGPLTEPRLAPEAIALDDGRVLVTSGGTAEVYDPTTGSFRALGPTGTDVDRFGAATVRLADGRVLLVGASRFEATAGAAVFDPRTDRFEPVADVPSHVVAIAALDDGTALLVGDSTALGTGSPTFAVVYDPEDGVTRELAGTTAHHPSVVRLADGRVLVVGGYDIDRGGQPLAVTELYR